jgi:hypothetical protein
MIVLPRLLFVLVAVSLMAVSQAQTPAPQTSAPSPPLLKSNPKISQPDFDAAKAEMLVAGGEKAELVYAARINAVQRSYDSLIVVYQKPARAGKD